MQIFSEGLFPFPYVDLKSLFANPIAKNMIFPHICTLTTIQHAYTQVAPLQPTYIRFCTQIKKWCRVSMSHHEIHDPWPSIYWKHSELTLQFHLKAINGSYPSVLCDRWQGCSRLSWLSIRIVKSSSMISMYGVPTVQTISLFVCL